MEHAPTQQPHDIRVTPVQWGFNGEPRVAALRLTYNGHSIYVPMNRIRALVDMCHDRADDHDRAIRQARQ